MLRRKSSGICFLLIYLSIIVLENNQILQMADMVTLVCYSFVGRLFVKALGKPSDILTKLNEMAGFSPNEEIELYEVLHNSAFISPDYT